MVLTSLSLSWHCFKIKEIMNVATSLGSSAHTVLNTRPSTEEL